MVNLCKPVHLKLVNSMHIGILDILESESHCFAGLRSHLGRWVAFLTVLGSPIHVPRGNDARGCVSLRGKLDCATLLLLCLI